MSKHVFIDNNYFDKMLGNQKGKIIKTISRFFMKKIFTPKLSAYFGLNLVKAAIKIDIKNNPDVYKQFPKKTFDILFTLLTDCLETINIDKNEKVKSKVERFINSNMNVIKHMKRADLSVKDVYDNLDKYTTFVEKEFGSQIFGTILSIVYTRQSDIKSCLKEKCDYVDNSYTEKVLELFDLSINRISKMNFITDLLSSKIENIDILRNYLSNSIPDFMLDDIIYGLKMYMKAKILPDNSETVEVKNAIKITIKNHIVYASYSLILFLIIFVLLAINVVFLLKRVLKNVKYSNILSSILMPNRQTINIISLTLKSNISIIAKLFVVMIYITTVVTSVIITSIVGIILFEFLVKFVIKRILGKRNE